MNLLRNIACSLLLLAATLPVHAQWKEDKVSLTPLKSEVRLSSSIGTLVHVSVQQPLEAVQNEFYLKLKGLVDAQTGAFYGNTKHLPQAGVRWVSIVNKKVYANLTAIYSPFSGMTTQMELTAVIPDTTSTLTEEDWASLEQVLKDSWNQPGLILQQKAQKSSDTKITSPYVQSKKPIKPARP